LTGAGWDGRVINQSVGFERVERMTMGSDQGPDVETEVRDGVMLVTLNRPERHNAIGGAMLRLLAEAFEEAARDDAVRAVVTTGAGGTFCPGADVEDFAAAADLPARELLCGDGIGGDKGLAALSPDQLRLEELGNPGRWTRRIWALDKPTVAAVGGLAVGGGMAIAMLHDLRVAAEDAKLGPGFAPLGLAPELGLSHLLPRVVGYAVAADLLFTGRLVSGAEASGLGLVTEAVPAPRVLERAMEIATRIAAAPPLGVRLTKRVLRRAVAEGLDDQLRAEFAAQLTLFDDPATRRAMERTRVRVTGPGRRG
jgi:enoyl-CoA hydratase/carnithine racemase